MSEAPVDVPKPIVQPVKMQQGVGEIPKVGNTYYANMGKSSTSTARFAANRTASATNAPRIGRAHV